MYFVTTTYYMKQTCWQDICHSDLTKIENDISIPQTLHHIVIVHNNTVCHKE